MKNKPRKQPHTIAAPAAPVEKKKFDWFFLANPLHQVLILMLIGFVFYINSAGNEYAFDDGLVIAENKYVQKGLSGLQDIFSRGELDAFYEKYGSKEQFSGGRYRPLSIATFAVEHEFFGENPAVRHIVNILLYLGTIAAMFYFLRRFVFPKNREIAFLATLLFAIHPVHSEVVANIKNRSELMALLFYLLSFINGFMYLEKGRIKDIVLSVFWLFLSLMSKEYGVLMIVLYPLAFWLIGRADLKKSVIRSLPYMLSIGAYILIRLSVTGWKFGGEATTDPLNNQYILADSEQKFATQVYVLLKYLKILIFPHPLAADYSFNQIPFIRFSDPKFIAGLIVYLGIGIYSVYLLVRRHIMAFFLVFFLAHVFMISNLVIEIGTTFGERIIYVASFGFCVLIAYGIFMAIKRVGLPELTSRIGLVTILSLLLVLSATKVWERNAVWKNDKTLFANDVKISSNSVLVLGNAAKNYLVMADDTTLEASVRDEYRRKSIEYNRKAVSIHPKFFNGYLNLLLAEASLKQFEDAEQSMAKAKGIFASHPNLKAAINYLASQYFWEGVRVGTAEKNYDESIRLMTRASELDPGNPDYYYNLGGAYFMKGDYSSAKKMWTKTLELKPDFIDARNGMAALPPGT